MLRENCRIGMKVVFGRLNGEKTVGEVTKIGRKKAQVKTLEARGGGFRLDHDKRPEHVDRKPAGTTFTPTFGLMEPLAQLEALRSLPPKDEGLLEYLSEGSRPFHYERYGASKNAILQSIFLVYETRGSLAENMRGLKDKGKIDEWIGRVEYQNQSLGHLFLALGRPVSQAVARTWHQEFLVYRIAEDGRTGVSKLEAIMVAQFLVRECRVRKLRPTTTMFTDRALRDFRMWKAGGLENHWKTLVKSTLDNTTTIHRLLQSRRGPRPTPLEWLRGASASL